MWNIERKTTLSQPLSYEQVWNCLELNFRWADTYQPEKGVPMTLKEKGSITGIITARLKKSFEQNGDDWFSEFWPVMKDALIRMNWYATYPETHKNSPGQFYGPFCLFNSSYAKASKLAIQRMEKKPKLIAPLIEQVTTEVFF